MVTASDIEGKYTTSEERHRRFRTRAVTWLALGAVLFYVILIWATANSGSLTARKVAPLALVVIALCSFVGFFVFARRAKEFDTGDKGVLVRAIFALLHTIEQYSQARSPGNLANVKQISQQSAASIRELAKSCDPRGYRQLAQLRDFLLRFGTFLRQAPDLVGQANTTELTQWRAGLQEMIIQVHEERWPDATSKVAALSARAVSDRPAALRWLLLQKDVVVWFFSAVVGLAILLVPLWMSLLFGFIKSEALPDGATFVVGFMGAWGTISMLVNPLVLLAYTYLNSQRATRT